MCVPWYFGIFLMIFIMALDNQMETTMIDRIDKNNVKIKL